MNPNEIILVIFGILKYLILFLTVFAGYKIGSRIFTTINRMVLFKRFDELWILYEHAKKTAFDTVLQNDITRHKTLEYVKITDPEMMVIQDKFIKIVLYELLSGKTVNDLSEMRGGVECLVNDLSAYFRGRTIEEDIKVIEKNAENGELLENVDLL